MIRFWVHDNLGIVQVPVFLERLLQAVFLSVKGQVPKTERIHLGTKAHFLHYRADLTAFSLLKKRVVFR